MSNRDNFKRFERELDVFFDEAEGDVGEATQKIALDALSRIVLKTPVDTGRARGNWQVGLNAEPDEVLDVEDPSGQQAISEGSQTIQEADNFDSISISNNVEYILFLEDGSSQQAPAGMVSVTLEELESIFKEVD